TPELPRRLKVYREAVRAAPLPAGHRNLHGMDRRLAAILDQCLETDPERRLRDGGAVVEALNRRTRARRQQPVLLFGLLAPLLLLVITAVAAMVMGRSALREAEEALIERQLKDNHILA